MHNRNVWGVYDKNWIFLKHSKLGYFVTKKWHSNRAVKIPRDNSLWCNVGCRERNKPTWMTVGKQKVEEGDIALLARLTVRAAWTGIKKERVCISFHRIQLSGPKGWSLFEDTDQISKIVPQSTRHSANLTLKILATSITAWSLIASRKVGERRGGRTWKGTLSLRGIPLSLQDHRYPMSDKKDR